MLHHATIKKTYLSSRGLGMMRIAVALAVFMLGTLAAPNASRADALPALTAGSDTVSVGDIFTIPI
jgi:hypothetical protein